MNGGPLSILHVVPTYLPAWRHGGPVFAVHGLARALVARGHRVSVYTTDVHGDGVLEVPRGEAVPLDGVEVRYFPVTFPRRLYRSPQLGRALAEVGSFDVLHLHSLFLWPTSAAARAGRRAGVPYLVAPRGMLVRELFRRRGRLRKRLWLRLVERRTLERAAGIHVTGEVEAAEAASFGLALPPLFEVPNGIDPGELALPDGASLSAAVREALRRRPLLLFLGRLSWKKGLDRLLAALPRIPGAHLVVAGNDEEGLWPALARQASREEVAERTLYLGPVAGADKAALLRGADVLVLPSSSENFGNVVLEAMAVGTPVVVTPEVGLARVVREVGAGLVSQGEPGELASSLRRLLTDPEERRRMGERGLAAARERFDWEAIARRMEEVYRALLGTAAPGRACR